MTTRSQKIRNAMRKYPWIWGITQRWFLKKDDFKVTTLTPEVLRQMKFSRISDLNGVSYFVYAKYPDDKEEVRRADTHQEEVRTGTPMAKVLLGQICVRFLVILGYTEGAHRYIHLYRIPRGTELADICEKTLKKL